MLLLVLVEFVGRGWDACRLAPSPSAMLRLPCPAPRAFWMVGKALLRCPTDVTHAGRCRSTVVELAAGSRRPPAAPQPPGPTSNRKQEGATYVRTYLPHTTNSNFCFLVFLVCCCLTCVHFRFLIIFNFYASLPVRFAVRPLLCLMIGDKQ